MHLYLVVKARLDSGALASYSRESVIQPHCYNYTPEQSRVTTNAPKQTGPTSSRKLGERSNPALAKARSLDVRQLLGDLEMWD